MTNPTILAVDDEPVNLTALRHVLADDYPLIFARDGAAALAAVAKHHPGLILMDVQMPGMDGYSVCRALKADPATQDIPVIFITSLSDIESETEGFTAGGVDFITKPFRAPVVRARVATHMSLVRATRLEQSYRESIFMLGSAGHYNDTDTGVHIWRMAAYSRALAQASGWSTVDCDTLELAAPMHDTGKVGIPDAILRKPGKLDDAEWVVMREHARIGHAILSRASAPVFVLAAEVALRHHERWDGRGYPDGLAGEAIPLAARIVALADVFDALSMKRPYKEAWPLERVVAKLREEAGHHFDPALVALFESNLPQLLEIKAEWDRRELASTGSETPDH